MSESNVDLEGAVKMWKVGQGYGFIRIDGETPNAVGAFLHITDVTEPSGVDAPTELAVGQRVRFRREVTERGARARDVELIFP